MKDISPVIVEEIVSALKELGGKAKAEYIKDQITKNRGGIPQQYSTRHTFRETIQGKIEEYCPQSKNYKNSNDALFERTARGIYKLSNYNKTNEAQIKMATLTNNIDQDLSYSQEKKNNQSQTSESTIFDEIDKYVDTYSGLDQTTRQSVINSRVGQGVFREGLLDLWDGCCSVTGCDLTELLIASHIKPWRFSNNYERLDIYNGLLLMPNLDRLFDQGYVSFSNEGGIVFSSLLTMDHKKLFGLNASLRLSILNEKTMSYLKFHREQVFHL